MCALSVKSGATACGTDTFTLAGILDQDTVQLNCPDDPAPQPDFTRSIPLNLRTGPSCPDLVVQIGCEGDYCQGFGFPVGSQIQALS